ncbi:hypothetical protein ACFQ5M_11400 [Agrilactobacillus yilanensis]|uniref:DUF4352 domain-containing protein n=1 Tax=Agrilactobacillus yilanensis TaxID=2485997 RepID=A0ABW4JAK7_9LACO|nr:hypothetical protein [Agrilactobacillus yilanensis]
MTKQRFYKNIWFWLFVISAIVAIVSLGLYHNAETANEHLEDKIEAIEDNKPPKKTNTADVAVDNNILQRQTGNRQNNKKYSIQKEAILKTLTNKKMYGMTLIQATQDFNSQGQTLLNGREIDDSLSKTKGVQITLKYKNYGDNDDFEPELDEFTVYQGNQEATILNQEADQIEVLKGQSAEMTFWVNLPKAVSENNKIEIDYTNDDVSNGITFKATVN